MTTTDTPRWTVTQFNSALLEHDGETCNEIFCISKDEAECLVDLLNELTERAERLRSTMRSFILVSPIEAQRMEKIEIERDENLERAEKAEAEVGRLERELAASQAKVERIRAEKNACLEGNEYYGDKAVVLQDKINKAIDVLMEKIQ